MPYVFMEELGEGMEPADVRTVEEYDAVVAERDTAFAERDALQTRYNELSDEADKVRVELGEAKTKFANAFLSSPYAAKAENAKDVKEESKPMTFEQLFTGRSSNAN